MAHIFPTLFHRIERCFLEVLDKDDLRIFLDASVTGILRGQARSVRRLLRARLKPGQALHRHAVDPRVAILTAQASERLDRFLGFFLSCQRIGGFEFLLANRKHLLSDPHRFALRDLRRHPGQHRWIRISKDTECRRVALAEEPGTHVALMVHGISTFTSAEWIDVRNGQVVRAFSLGNDPALWREAPAPGAALGHHKIEEVFYRARAKRWAA